MFLTLVITRQCNLACTYCPVLKKKDFLEKKIAFKAIDFYLGSFKGSQAKIRMFGGEPFLNIPLLEEIITHIRKTNKSAKIELTTNGSFLDKRLVSWLLSREVDLIVSLDGDFQTQTRNRKGMKRNNFENIFSSLRPFLEKITFNMVLAPNNVGDFMKNFVYLFETGARRFNLLPAAYVSWKKDEIDLLKRQLSVLGFFLKNNKGIYIKNFDRSEKLFLLNTGITVDTNGDIFFSDAVMLKQFQKIKNGLRASNIKDVESFDFVKGADAKKKFQKTAQLIRKATKPAILKSNDAISSAVNAFVSDAKKDESTRKVLDIKIGYQCNNHCYFCAQGHKRDMCSFRKKEKIREELRKTRESRSTVVFTGGEPTLHPDFLELVGYARELNYESIQIQTNGRMFGYKKFCVETVRRGGGNAVIESSPSLHGHKASLHDYLTCAPGSFNQTVQGIKNMKALGQRVVTNSVITSSNYRHLPALAKLLVSLNVDQFQFAFVHIVGTARENRKWIVPKKSDIMPYVKKGLDIGKKAGKKVKTEAIPYCLMRGYEDCIAEQIIPEGKVIEKNLVVENFTDYRRNIGKKKAKKCEKCVYFSICEGPWKEYPELFGWDEFEPIRIRK